jgi:tetratricopeptide (TPR) repeat protein
MEVDLIINMGFFIRDLHKHIAQLHSEQYTGHSHSDSFIVYRGQGLSRTNFDQLMKTRGELLSFNNFLSTSKNRQTALDFACETIQTADIMGILFVMKIDPSTPSTPFANVRDVSYYQREEEILFSMHSIFRIGHMKQMDSNNGRLWQVELTLTSDNDPQLHALTAQIRKETYPHKKGWDRLAELLIKLGQFNKAQQVCEVMLAQTPSDYGTASIYHMLGMVNGHLGKYAEAITFYKKSNEILQKILPPTHSDLASSYNNIGNVYSSVEEYSKALSFYEKALQISEKMLPSNHPDLAIAYGNIGSANMDMGRHSTALSFYEKALAVKQKSLPQNHPSLATSYNNIATLYKRMGDYSKALSSYEQAREIKEKILPPNHPDLAITYCNIGCLYADMGNYSKALSFLQRALDIGQHSLPANHDHLQLYKKHIEAIKKKL